MRNYFWAWTLLLIIQLISCDSARKIDSEEGTYLIDTTIPFVTDSLISPRALLTDVEYIKLGSPEKFFLTEAKKILELDNKLFVLDKNKKVVVAYDLQGNFIGQVGKKGLGPKEYQKVSDFLVNPKRNSILIFSRPDLAILEFDSNLSFKSKTRLKVWAFQISLLESGNIGFYTSFDEGSSNILVYNYEGEQVDRRMPYPEKGHYIPMDYTGFIVGNYYTYPLSSKIFRLNEEKRSDSEVFEINFPDRLQEEKKFEHAEFLLGPWLDHQILCKFSIGKDAEELLFYYSYKEQRSSGFTLGIKLSSSQVFGHLNLKHGIKRHSDPFVRLFFLGPYNLPTYSNASGYYYTAPTNESLNEFYAGDRNANLKEIREIDYNLYKVLEGAKDSENPFLMRFKLRKEL